MSYVQDGLAAGQTVPHVHFHLLPRKLVGDPFEGRNDEIYPALEQSEEALPKHLDLLEPKGRDSVTRAEPIKVDADENRKPRSLEEMEREANWLKEFFVDKVGADVCINHLHLSEFLKQPFDLAGSSLMSLRCTKVVSDNVNHLPLFRACSISVTRFSLQ